MSDAATPRVAPGGWRDTGPVAWAFAQLAGRVAGTQAPNIFLTLGRTRGLFWGWLHFAGSLMPGGKLPRRETELVILRVAHLRGSEYERRHHVRIAARVGVTADEVARVASGPDAAGWSAREECILRVVDELHETGDVDDVTWSRLRSHLDDRQLVEICLLVGHYEMLATTIRALRMQPDRPRVRG